LTARRRSPRRGLDASWPLTPYDTPCGRGSALLPANRRREPSRATPLRLSGVLVGGAGHHRRAERCWLQPPRFLDIARTGARTDTAEHVVTTLPVVIDSLRDWLMLTPGFFHLIQATNSSSMQFLRWHVVGVGHLCQLIRAHTAASPRSVQSLRTPNPGHQLPPKSTCRASNL
jgi:hypothetical protein